MPTGKKAFSSSMMGFIIGKDSFLQFGLQAGPGTSSILLSQTGPTEWLGGRIAMLWFLSGISWLNIDLCGGNLLGLALSALLYLLITMLMITYLCISPAPLADASATSGLIAYMPSFFSIRAFLATASRVLWFIMLY